MGEGLKRAFAATARTRSDPTPTEDMKLFIVSLTPGKTHTRGEITVHCNRNQDKARQACRKFGYAEYVRREDGKEGWRLTKLGERIREELITGSPAR